MRSTPGELRSDNFSIKYIMKEKIGAGAFSSVHLAESKLSGIEYAVKMIEIEKLNDENKRLIQ